MISVKASLGSAIRRNDVSKAAVLVRRARSKRPNFFAGPLVLASRLGRIRMIHLLVQAGADPLGRAGEAIRAAGDIGNLPALEALIGTLGPERGQAARVDRASKAALECALLSAAFAGHVGVCRLLLESGADVDAREGGSDGLTSLMHAALVDDRDLLELAISFGANVNSRAIGGYTPLIMATLHDHIHQLRSLLAAGADPSLRDRRGRTAMDLARSAAAAELLTAAAEGRERP
jgi:ankyrin repeat protein